MNLLSEYARFLREFRDEFHTTGALLPSGPFLAMCLASPLRSTRRPWRILEVGPGTGSVTCAIAHRMKPGDRLDAVEINARFVESLRRRIERERVFAPHRESIEVVHAGVEDLIGENIYDLIVSGLPLNNFAPGEVRSIFATFTRLLRPGGLLTYFEYTLVRDIKAPFVNRPERRRLLRVGRVVRRYIRRHQVKREHVLVNVPPAVVRQLKLKPMPILRPSGAV